VRIGHEKLLEGQRRGKGVLYLTGHIALELSSFAHALYGFPALYAPPESKPENHHAGAIVRFLKIDIRPDVMDSLCVDRRPIVQGKSVDACAKEDNSTRRCARSDKHAFSAPLPSRKFHGIQHDHLLDIFSNIFGNRANSAASPGFRSIPQYALRSFAPSERQCADHPAVFLIQSTP